MEFKGTGKKWKTIGNEIWNDGGFPTIIGLAYPHNPLNISIEEQRANAQLMSKAPEMLEALNGLVLALKNTTEYDVLDVYKEMVLRTEHLIKEATTING